MPPATIASYLSTFESFVTEYFVERGIQPTRVDSRHSLDHDAIELRVIVRRNGQDYYVVYAISNDTLRYAQGDLGEVGAQAVIAATREMYDSMRAQLPPEAEPWARSYAGATTSAFVRFQPLASGMTSPMMGTGMMPPVVRQPRTVEQVAELKMDQLGAPKRKPKPPPTMWEHLLADDDY